MNPIIRIMASPVLFWVQDRKVVRHLEEWKAANQEGNLARAVKLRDTFQPKMDEMQNLGLWGVPIFFCWTWVIFAAIIWFWKHTA